MKHLKSHFISESYILGKKTYWDFPKLGFYRPIATHQERAMYELHCTEYRYCQKLKLRAKRGKVLPTAQHDIPVSARQYGRNWKHHSKRRYQWYSKV